MLSVIGMTIYKVGHMNILQTILLLENQLNREAPYQMMYLGMVHNWLWMEIKWELPMVICPFGHVVTLQ